MTNKTTVNKTICKFNEQCFEEFLMQEIAEFKAIHQFTIDAINNGNECSMANQCWQVQIVVMRNDDKTKKLPYLLETPTNEQLMPLIPQQKFEKEFILYDELLPAFEGLYEKVGKVLKFAAKRHKLTAAAMDNDYLLLDDAKSMGFVQLGPTLKRNDDKHMKSCLEKLAAFHAASVVYCSKHSLAKLFTKSPLNEMQLNEYKQQCIPYNRKFNECLRFYDLREYQDQLKQYQEFCNTELQRMHTPDRNEFNVLLHGNCNGASILQQYDAFGNIKETIFKNFHSTHMGSPAKDLWQLLMSVGRQLHKFDFHIKYYHDHLIANLELLKCTNEMPKLCDLHIAMYKYSPWGFMTLAKQLPLVFYETNGEALRQCNEHERLKHLYENPHLYKEIAPILPWMHTRGFLEI